MSLDNEDQRAFLLELIKAGGFSGESLDFVMAVRQAIRTAPIAKPQEQTE